MYAEFTDTLITGNKTIDSQHKELIEKMNNLLQNCETNKELTSAIRTLNYLSDYTDFHFKEEEQLQRDIDYPGMKEHLAQHRAFEQTIQELHDMLVEDEGPSPAFVKAVEENIVNWFYNHIQSYDRSVAEYIHIRSNSERL